MTCDPSLDLFFFFLSTQSWQAKGACRYTWEGRQQSILRSATDPTNHATNDCLFPVALLLLLPCKSEVHTSVSDGPNRDDSCSDNKWVVGRVETLVGVQVILGRTLACEWCPFVLRPVQSRGRWHTARCQSACSLCSGFSCDSERHGQKWCSGWIPYCAGYVVPIRCWRRRCVMRWFFLQ